MKKSEKIALIIAVFTFIISMINPLEKKDKKDSKDFVKVVLAGSSIEAKSEIRRDMLIEKELPHFSVPSNYIENADDIVGKVSSTTIYPDDVITSDKILDKQTAQAGLSVVIPEGKRAITLNVEQSSGVAGLIDISDRVDIISTISEEKNIKSIIVAQNIEVLALDKRLGKDLKGETVQYATVTLAVDIKEALRINLAENQASPLKLILRQDGDMSDIQLNSLNINDLVQQ